MTLQEQAQQQADLLQRWMNDLQELHVTGDPTRVAVVCVDLVEGFTRQGPLASPRVEGIIPNAVNLIQELLRAGVPAQNVVLVQDFHPADAQEFKAYPAHCVAGTPEAEAVSELQALPQFAAFRHFRKNSIASHTSPEFQAWLAGTDVDTVIAIGDVTDLCLYTLALHLVTYGMSVQREWSVLVAESCVQTWDAPGHPGDLYHALFLHQLERNGVRVGRTVALSLG